METKERVDSYLAESTGVGGIEQGAIPLSSFSARVWVKGLGGFDVPPVDKKASPQMTSPMRCLRATHFALAGGFTCHGDGFGFAHSCRRPGTSTDSVDKPREWDPVTFPTGLRSAPSSNHRGREAAVDRIVS